jgi:hypothetical protein
MGHNKRKGKDSVVEPPKKKTHAQKEADRAAIAARATNDQAAGRERTFQIREPGARTKEQQDEPVGSSPRRSLRVRLRTRGGHTEHQGHHPSQREIRACHSRTTAQDRAQDYEVVTAMYRMDTAVMLQKVPSCRI